jgi:cytochrome P450
MGRSADTHPRHAAIAPVPLRIGGDCYVVRDYQQVLLLLHDPRLSPVGSDSDADAGMPSPLRWDPSGHDGPELMVMRPCRPIDHINPFADIEDQIVETTHALIDALAKDRQAELVGRFAHQLSASIFYRLLDIPRWDERRFHEWMAFIIDGIGNGTSQSQAIIAEKKLAAYLTGLAMGRRGGSGTDMLSRLVNEDRPEGCLPDASIGTMAALLLMASHLTTVNLITNGILTLIKHPAEAERLCKDPVHATAIVDVLLRLEPPAEFFQSRSAMADIALGDVIIPEGSNVILLLSPANRNTARFTAADRLEQDRSDNQHLAFCSGVQSCFGTSLARLQGQIALSLFFERVVNPRLVGETRYRSSWPLCGPSQLIVAYNGVRRHIET